MPEKMTFGKDRTAAVIRTPVLRVEAVRWDWNAGKRRDARPIDLTPAIQNFRWMKSTRNPESGCEITLIPQVGDVHYLDLLETMDVIRIFEFSILKYQGFIRRIGARGAISNTGAPSRLVTVSCSSFGALFSEAQLGVNMFLKAGEFNNLKTIINEFAGKISDLVSSNQPYSELIGSMVDEWLKFIEKCGADKYKKYFDEWIDYRSGLQGKLIPGMVRDPYLFSGSEESISLWEIINKFAEAPFNEVWFDCGPREVYVERNATLSPPKPSTVKLDSERDYLVIRTPPFNGTVVNGTEVNLWDSMPAKKIPLSYLTQFDLNKSMDESNSFYMVSPSVYNPGSLALVALGKYKFDKDAFNKYLYRPMTANLFYARVTDPGTTDLEKQLDVYSYAEDKAQTLLNWFKLNDKYLSGAFTFMVPSDEQFDPRIGDKLEIENLPDMYFYVEGVSHSWNYGGALISNVSVTRGYGLNKPIELKDKIFRRGKFVMGRDFQ